MLSDAELTQFAYLISARFEAVNSLYLKKMGNHINSIGRLTASDVRRLEQMMLMQQNIGEINNQLAQATRLSLNDLYQLYDMSGMSVYGDTAKFYKANGKNQVPFSDNIWIQNYLEAIKRQTAGTFANISRTTSIQNDYRDLVDTAITAVTSGMTDYKSAIRMQMSDAAMQGIRVQYASGASRRLDSAIRMNVLEGIKQINNGIRQQAGEEFGADGVEISVHALCAPDHIEIQGRQFSNQDFAKIQANLKRKISTCNCQHYIFPIVLDIAEPVNSSSELDSYKRLSEQSVLLTTGYKKVGVDEAGKDIYSPITRTCTRYEATQYQRNIETEVRKAKDVHIIAEASKDKVLQKQAKQRIKGLRETYKRISNEAVLTPKWDRMYVPGYNGKQVVPKSLKIHSYDIQSHNNKYKELIGGKNNPELSDKLEDLFLPQDIRDKLPEIESMRTYSQFEQWLNSKGIELDTDLEKLKTIRRNDEIPSVYKLTQTIRTAIETYESEFGPEALSTLKRIKLYDNDLDNLASYHFNRLGENDLLAGTIRFKDWSADGKDVFHELAHALQDSHKLQGEDAILSANRLVELGELDKTFRGNVNFTDETEWAEKMAEAFGSGFGRGNKKGIEFIKNLVNALK